MKRILPHHRLEDFVLWLDVLSSTCNLKVLGFIPLHAHVSPASCLMATCHSGELDQSQVSLVHVKVSPARPHTSLTSVQIERIHLFHLALCKIVELIPFAIQLCTSNLDTIQPHGRPQIPGKLGIEAVTFQSPLRFTFIWFWASQYKPSQSRHES
ncbi:hypothetical protein EJ08DRAFT_382364 [Tothia fuscella]|uniref:Uncharacterized protein n=1 Tax=Tothia fuscella TaxID=1048955 RepID=A0A9P4NL62_9PEZI|nr:hypothetical protein EJ08DRAFT_382364 [Tothia fuscella]